MTLIEHGSIEVRARSQVSAGELQQAASILGLSVDDVSATVRQNATNTGAMITPGFPLDTKAAKSQIKNRVGVTLGEAIDPATLFDPVPETLLNAWSGTLGDDQQVEVLLWRTAE